MLQQLRVVSDRVINNIEVGSRDLFGNFVASASTDTESRGPGRPTEIFWVKGELPPPYPDKDRLVVIEDGDLRLFREGVLKITLEIMEDGQTGDEQFLDCLDWILDTETGGLSFSECALATSVDGVRCDPDFLRWRILRDMRDRISDLRKKAKEGAFEHYFRFL